jgi:hypothetical protein
LKSPKGYRVPGLISSTDIRPCFSIQHPAGCFDSLNAAAETGCAAQRGAIKTGIVPEYPG